MSYAPKTFRDVVDAIDAFSFSDVVETYARKSGKSTERINDELALLRRYLALCIAHPNESLRMFDMADDLWHEFICHTRLYAKFCLSIAGFFIHHEPYLDRNKPHPVDLGATRELYERHFGQLPVEFVGLGDCKGGDCRSCQSGPSVSAFASGNLEARDLPERKTYSW